MALTDRQKRFCDEYLIDLNATKAAVRAGYKALNANRVGPALLTKPHVLDEIAKLKAARAARVEITQDRVLKELADVGFAKAADYINADLKVGNKIRALELLGKHLGMWDKAAGAADVEDLTPLSELLRGDADE